MVLRFKRVQEVAFSLKLSRRRKLRQQYDKKSFSGGFVMRAGPMKNV